MMPTNKEILNKVHFNLGDKDTHVIDATVWRADRTVNSNETRAWSTADTQITCVYSDHATGLVRKSPAGNLLRLKYRHEAQMLLISWYFSRVSCLSSHQRD